MNPPIDCRSVITSQEPLYAFTASQNLAPALLAVFGVAGVCAWLVADASTGSSARNALRIILLIAALATVSGALLLTG